MKFRTLTAGALGLGLTGLVAAGARTAPLEGGPPPHLAGAWKINRELSDDPGRKVMEARRGAGLEGGRGGGMGGRGGGGMRGPGGGGGMMGGRGGMRGGSPEGRGGPGGLLSNEPPLDGNPEADRPLGGPVPSPLFHIDQDGDNIAFRTDANLRLLHSDGEKRKRSNGAGQQEVVARFLKGSLVVETRGERAGKRKETYTLREDGKLEADFDIGGAGRTPGLKFKLVYDRAGEGGTSNPGSPDRR